MFIAIDIVPTTAIPPSLSYSRWELSLCYLWLKELAVDLATVPLGYVALSSSRLIPLDFHDIGDIEYDLIRSALMKLERPEKLVNTLEVCQYQ